MFTIRQRHLEAFAHDQRTRFEERLLVHVREAFPGEIRGLPESELRARLARTVTRALSYGIEVEMEGVCFADLTFLFGEHFDTEPKYGWASEILLDPLLEGHQRIARLGDGWIPGRG